MPTILGRSKLRWLWSVALTVLIFLTLSVQTAYESPATVFDVSPAQQAATHSLLCMGGGNLTLSYYNWSELSARPHLLAAFAKAPTPPRVYDGSGSGFGHLAWMLKPGQCALASGRLNASQPNVLLLRHPVLPPDQMAIAWSMGDKATVLNAPAIVQQLLNESYVQFSVYDDGLGHWVVTSVEPFYDVSLQASGCRPDEVIRVMMANTGLSLEEAKALVAAGSGTAFKAVSFEDARTAASQLTKAGATVSVVDGAGAEANLPSKDLGPFVLAIEDAFSIRGRGTVVTGLVQRGQVRTGDGVEIVGFRTPRRTTVTGLERFQKVIDEGRACDQVGVLLRGVDREEVERGQVLSAPGGIAAHSRFEAVVAVLTRADGGRARTILRGYRPLFFIGKASVTGEVRLPRGVEMIPPGARETVEVRLIRGTPLEEGTSFAMTESGRDVAYGVVTKIIE